MRFYREDKRERDCSCWRCGFDEFYDQVRAKARAKARSRSGLGWGINKVPFASLCGKNTSQIIQNHFKQRFNILKNHKSNITNTCLTYNG